MTGCAVMGFNEISMDEMFAIDGGAWSWKEFGKATAAGGVAGVITGATGGTVTLPVVGTIAGAAAVGVFGAAVGAVVYATTGWW